MKKTAHVAVCNSVTWRKYARRKWESHTSARFLRNDSPIRCIAKPACAPGQLRDVQGDCCCPSGTAEGPNGNELPTQCVANA